MAPLSSQIPRGEYMSQDSCSCSFPIMLSVAQLVKESAASAGDLGSIPGLGRSPGEGKGYPLQYSGLENSMNSIVHRITKSQTRLSAFQFHFHFQVLASINFTSYDSHKTPMRNAPLSSHSMHKKNESCTTMSRVYCYMAMKW